MKGPQLIAHRGYARHFPENTLASVGGALAAGARAVEIDVQLSSDRVPYLMHDRTLERMCGEVGAISDHSSAEIGRMHAAERERFGAKFEAEPVASLDSFVATMKRHTEVRAFIEIKRAAIEAFDNDTVLEAVIPRLEPIRQRCTLISFDVGILVRARERFPHRLGPVLIAFSQIQTDEIAKLRPDVIFCDLDKLPDSGPLASPCDLAVYEVDDPQLALALHARGVALIETFAIGEMLRALG